MDGMHLHAANVLQKVPSDISRLQGSASGGMVSRAMRRTVLSAIIERDVIPELLFGQSGRHDSAASLSRETDELTALALGPCCSAVTDYVAELASRGRSAESLCLDLLTPVARRLGEGWVDDTCDFTDVTIGVWRLHDAMRTLYPAVAGGQARLSALIMPLPGEQHTFGIAMVSEFFRKAGWDSWSGETGTAEELIAVVRSRRFDLVGLSLSSVEFVEAARLAVTAIRVHSSNPDVVVMLGGAPFLSNPELATEIGADATATDATEAVVRAGDLLVARGRVQPAAVG